MGHPVRYFDGDPLLAQLRNICLGFPRSAERISHGRPNFFTRRTFAHFGATVKGDHHDGRWDRALQVLPDPHERDALLQDSRFFVPGYTGPAGWVGIDLSAGTPDWDEITELIDMSYRMTASITCVRLLDAR